MTSQDEEFSRQYFQLQSQSEAEITPVIIQLSILEAITSARQLEKSVAKERSEIIQLSLLEAITLARQRKCR